MDWRWPLALGLLLAVAALSWWLGRDTGRGEEPPAPAAVGERRPDYFMRDAHITRTTSSGRVLYELDAAEINHYRGDDRTELTEVALRYFPADAPPWRLVAQRATIPDSRERVTLEGDVRATLRQAGAAADITLHTPRLLVMVDAERATTDAGVRITRGDSVVTGRSMTADLAASTVLLKDSVRGTYVPQPR